MENFKIETYHDKDTRVKITAITNTCGSLIANNLYTDNPVYSKDGRYLLFSSGQDCFVNCDLFLFDIPEKKILRLTKDENAICTVFSAMTGSILYMTRKKDVYLVKSINMATMQEKEITCLAKVVSSYVLGAVSPDGTKYATGISYGPDDAAVIEVETESGKVSEICRRKDVWNPHMNYSPASNDEIMVQVNRGWGLIKHENGKVDLKRRPGEEHKRPFLAVYKRREQKWEMEYLPFGYLLPWDNTEIQGHQSWAGTTGEVIAGIFRYDYYGHGVTPGAENIIVDRKGVIMTARPGDKTPAMVSDAFDFRHPSARADGKVIACDEWGERRIYLVNHATGKTVLLCHTHSEYVPPYNSQSAHPHPDISPDGRYVAFNSTVSGKPGVYVAEVNGEIEEKIF